MSRSYYDELGVGRDATSEEISHAFRKRSLIAHPDRKGGSTETFQRLQRIHGVLSDPAQRAKYDKYGAEEASTGDHFSETVALIPFFGSSLLVGAFGTVSVWLSPIGLGSFFCFTEPGAARRRAMADPLPVILSTSVGYLAGVALGLSLGGVCSATAGLARRLAR